MSALGLGGYFEHDPDEESSDDESDQQHSPTDHANDLKYFVQSDMAAQHASGQAGTSGEVAPGAPHLVCRIA